MPHLHHLQVLPADRRLVGPIRVLHLQAQRLPTLVLPGHPPLPWLRAMRDLREVPARRMAMIHRRLAHKGMCARD